MIVFIGVLAYEMAMHLPIKNIIIRTVTVYIVTLAVLLLPYGRHIILSLWQKVLIKMFL